MFFARSKENAIQRERERRSPHRRIGAVNFQFYIFNPTDLNVKKRWKSERERAPVYAYKSSAIRLLLPLLQLLLLLLAVLVVIDVFVIELLCMCVMTVAAAAAAVAAVTVTVFVVVLLYIYAVAHHYFSVRYTCFEVSRAPSSHFTFIFRLTIAYRFSFLLFFHFSPARFVFSFNRNFCVYIAVVINYCYHFMLSFDSGRKMKLLLCTV